MSRWLKVSYLLITAHIETAARAGPVLLMLLIGSMGGSAAFTDQVGQTPRIAVVCAFAPEWLALKDAMSESQTQTIADTTYVAGKLQGKDVVLFLSGISMVNAAMTTQGAIDHFKITRIVFSGIAGGTNPALNAGDVVVPERWSEYLESVFARRHRPVGQCRNGSARRCQIMA